MIWFGLLSWHINYCRLFNAKSCFYIYILNIWFVNTFCWHIFKWAWAHSFVHNEMASRISTQHEYLYWLFIICLLTVKKFQLFLCNSNNVISVIICLDTLKWSWVFNTNYSIQHYSFIYTVKWSNSSISNNSVLHKSFVCTQFKCQTVLFVP